MMSRPSDHVSLLARQITPRYVYIVSTFYTFFFAFCEFMHLQVCVLSINMWLIEQYNVPALNTCWMGLFLCCLNDTWSQ